MVTSFLVPQRFTAAFAKDVAPFEIDGSCLPREWEHSASVNTLAQYPVESGDLAECCEPRFAPHTAATFTTCRFDNEQEGANAVRGLIPSPQFAAHAGLRWSRRELSFSTAAGHGEAVAFHQHRQSEACVARRDLVLRTLETNGLALVWRLYAWKVLLGEGTRECHQREYWATYTLDVEGKLACRDAVSALNWDRVRTQRPPWALLPPQPSRRPR